MVVCVVCTERFLGCKKQFTVLSVQGGGSNLCKCVWHGVAPGGNRNDKSYKIAAYLSNSNYEGRYSMQLVETPAWNS